jgi:hypothetical protein
MTHESNTTGKDICPQATAVMSKTTDLKIDKKTSLLLNHPRRLLQQVKNGLTASEYELFCTTHK